MKNRIQEVYKGWTKDSKSRGNRKITVSAPDLGQEDLYKNCFKKALKGKKNPLVLVLGATPELRNLIMNMGYRVLAVDINYNMIFNLGTNIENKDSLKNMMMRANWLDIDKLLKNNNFDAVAGDGVLGQLDPVGIKKLIENVKNILKPGGYFITRIDVYNYELSTTPLIDLLEQYRKKEIDFLNFGMRVLLYSDYSNELYDRRKKIAYTYKVWELFDKLYKKGIITKRENDFFQERKINLTHYMLPKKELYGKIMAKNFKEITLKQFDEVWPTYMGKVKK